MSPVRAEQQTDSERRNRGADGCPVMHGQVLARVSVHTFGGLTVVGGAEPKVSLSARQRQFLRWLVLAPWGPPLEVATVCDIMWPGVDGAAANSNFSSTVRRMRRVLGGPTSILVEAGTVRLHPAACRTDLDLLLDIQARLASENFADQAPNLAMKMLAAFSGENPVLRARSDSRDMVLRVQAVETAWRHATLHLARHLQGTAHAGLALRLCERIERHGLADARVLAQWQVLAETCWLSPAG